MTQNPARGAIAATYRPAELNWLRPTLRQIDDSLTAHPLVETSAGSTPAPPVNQPVTSSAAPEADLIEPTRPEFDPRGWAVHIQMLGDSKLQVDAAKALAKKQLRAQARSLREKAYRARKNANSAGQ